MRKITLAVIILLSAIPVFGQVTISPMISEVTANKVGKASGEVTFMNPGIEPVIISIAARSFSLDKSGKGMFSSVPADMNLRLSSTSGKLGPRQSQTYGWDVTCPHSCAFQLFANTSATQKVQNGIAVKVVFTSTVYVYRHGALNPSDFSATLSPDGKTISIHNAGDDNLCRPLVFATIAGHQEGLGGFPVFPHADRDVSLPDAADKAEVRFPHFRITATKAANSIGN